MGTFEVNRLHALMIEDEDMPLVAEACILMQAGFRITTVEYHHRSLDKIEPHEYDIIILDLSVHAQTYMEIVHKVVAALPKDHQQLPIIAIALPEDASAIQNNREITAAIAKPITPQALIEHLIKIFPAQKERFQKREDWDVKVMVGGHDWGTFIESGEDKKS